MISYVIAVIVGIWFFISAQALQKTAWVWALIGAASYAGTAFLVGNLSFWIASPIRHDDMPKTVIIVVVGSLIFAFVVTLLIHWKFLRKIGNESGSKDDDFRSIWRRWWK